MRKEELIKELLMGYEELADYLKEKYGPAKYDYFCNESCRTVNKKTSRSSEGLQCHHIDEDKHGNLSVPQLAKRHPYKYQKKDRLVYCNLIEHCLLHHKINEFTQAYPKVSPIDIRDFFNSQGVFHVSGLINDLFMKKGSSISYLQHYYDAIKDDYDNYIWMIAMILKNLEITYCGEKKPKMIVANNSVQVHGMTGIVKGYTQDSYTIDVQYKNGTVESVRPEDIENLSHLDYIDGVIRAFSAGKSGLYYETIYEEVHAKLSSITEEDETVLEELRGRTELLAEKTLVYIDDSSTPIDITFNNNKRLVLGERIYDRRYGLGTIIETESGLGTALLKISFDAKGIKSIPKDVFVERNMVLKYVEEMPKNQGEDANENKLPNLNNMNSAAQTEKLDYQIGDIVFHKVFGKGKVVAIQPIAGLTFIDIDFEKGGQKKIASGFVSKA